MTKIAETIFDVTEAEARAALLLRLASCPGEPVADTELIFTVGGIGLFQRALSRLVAEGERKGSPFTIERRGEALALRRRF